LSGKYRKYHKSHDIFDILIFSKIPTLNGTAVAASY